MTDEQKKAVNFNSNALIEACPGSGKTRTITAKILKCLEEVKKSSRKVACITYTNAAVHEIEYRLRMYGTSDNEDYYEVSTIHTFCLNNILRRFYWRIPEYNTGFTILSPEDERYQEIVELKCDRYNLEYRNREAFELSNREPDGTPISSLAPEVINDFWRNLKNNHFIDFTNIIYYSYVLILKYPSIAHGLSCRFAWMLVDEFQDTSSLQVEIMKIIASCNRTRFFLVGDPYQSIFSFAGARPSLMKEFAECIGAKQSLSLNGNFRSSPEIIKNAELLIPRLPPMIAKGKSMSFSDKAIYKHTSTTVEAIDNYYLPSLNRLNIEYGEAAILAPSWYSLFPIGRHLREHNIPVHGPGSRPYRKNRLIARFAESMCAYIDGKRIQDLKVLERELFMLVQNITGESQYEIFSYKGRVMLFRMISSAQTFRQKMPGVSAWLEGVAESISEVLIDSGLLGEKDKDVMLSSATDIIEDIKGNDIDPIKFPVVQLGMFAVPDKSIKLLTMHRAKGREFDAVAIIDIHDSSLPHWRTHGNQIGIDEQLRLFYVAVTRARRLVMYVTDSGKAKNKPSRFLSKLAILFP